ncbi:MAG: hypothetical protein AAFZ01_08470 [Pseudomonadota bacterium]
MLTEQLLMYAIYAMLVFGALAIIYVVAPIVIPLLLIIGVLGGLTFGITRAAAWLEHRVHGDD